MKSMKSMKQVALIVMIAMAVVVIGMMMVRSSAADLPALWTPAHTHAPCGVYGTPLDTHFHVGHSHLLPSGDHA
jgi:hypothetical protein